jgi:hypothetical protein
MSMDYQGRTSPVMMIVSDEEADDDAGDDGRDDSP